jgi:hypothetical protein
MSRLQIKIFPLMLDTPDFVWVDILILFFILCNSIIRPAPFPEFV